MSTLKILVASHAGVLEVNRALFQELEKLGKYDVSMLVPTSWQGDLISGLTYRKNSSENLKIYSLPVSNSGNGSLFFYRGPLSKVLKEVSPDLLLIDEEPWSFAAAQLIKKSCGTKIVFYTKQNLKKRIPLPFRILQKWIFSKSTAALSVESEVEEVLRWKGYSKKIFELPHSFDPRLFKKISKSEKDTVRRQYKISSDAILFMYCGRLSEDKGIEDLLEAISRLEKDAPTRPIEFLIVGNGVLAGKVQEFCQENRKIKVATADAIPHDKIGHTMAAADVLILPSRTMPNWKEQFGRVLVEAMACGLAVIGSNSGAIARVIERTGGGLVFNEGKVGELSDAIRNLAEDSNQLSLLKERGFSYVNENLTHEAQAKKLSEYISKILA